jgi:hypothetical protein
MSAGEEQFLLGARRWVIDTVKHLRENDHKQLLVEVMSGEALTTSEIEGETLNRGEWTQPRRGMWHGGGAGHARQLTNIMDISLILRM